MDTSQVADHLGTTARTLRAFLRSPQSTYVAVGSGARYDFRESDLPTLSKRFADWRSLGSARLEPPASKPAKTARGRTTRREDKDQKVWDEEGSVEIPDIRDPRVRLRVQADARAAEDRLTMMLIAAGLHITQPGFTTSRRAS